MALIEGKKCKVTLGTDTIVGIGDWSMNGVSVDLLESTAFTNTWKQYKYGLSDGGTISFSGLYSNTDTTGQDVLRAANINKTEITNLRLYANSTSYYEPNRTTGYITPSSTTLNDTELSHVKVTQFSINASVGDMVKVSFELKVCGSMSLV